jgi:hypothetical protein
MHQPGGGAGPRARVQDVDEERTTAATTSLTTVGTTAATTSLMAAGTTAPRHGDIDDRYRGSASTDDDVLSTVAVRLLYRLL